MSQHLNDRIEQVFYKVNNIQIAPTPVQAAVGIKSGGGGAGAGAGGGIKERFSTRVPKLDLRGGERKLTIKKNTAQGKVEVKKEEVKNDN